MLLGSQLSCGIQYPKGCGLGQPVEDGLPKVETCLQAMLEMLNGGEPMLEARSSREDISERPSWDGLAETHGEASSEMAEAVAGAMTGVDSSEPSRAALSRGPLSRSGSCLTCSSCTDHNSDSSLRHEHSRALRTFLQRRQIVGGAQKQLQCCLRLCISATLSQSWPRPQRASFVVFCQRWLSEHATVADSCVPMQLHAQ